MSKIGNILKSLRIRENLTQDELAEKIGFSRSAIGMYEQGRRIPPADILDIFADFYNVDMNYITGRTVAFPPILVNLFLQHKENEKVKKELVGEDWQGSKDIEDDFVFTQKNGKAMFVGSIPKWFRKFIKKHNLKHITFHGLRHTNSTILISKNINIVSVSHNLGHAKTSTTTDLYSHHLESVEDSMANVFEEIIVENQNKNQSGTKSGSQDQNLRIVK